MTGPDNAADSRQGRQPDQATTLAAVTQRVQQALLPPSPMAIGNYRLEHRLRIGPAAGTDFVDYFVIAESHCCLVLISLPTAAPLSVLTAVLLKNSSRRLRREFRRSMLSDPLEIVRWLVEELSAQGLLTNFGITLGVGSIDGGPLRFVRAGASAPALLLDRGPVPGRRLADPAPEPAEGPQIESLELTDGSSLLVISSGAERALPLIESEPDVLRWWEAWEALQALPAPAAGPDASALLLRRR